MKVSAIIPAYNEAEWIGGVIKPLKEVKKVDEIIVVDDGSTDDTALIAQGFGVCVLSLPQNMGKAAALDQGVKAAKNDILLFLDADLVGLKPHHIEEMIRAYENGSDMVVGVFREGRKATDLGQIIPYFSGQRVLSKALWEEVCRRRETEKIGFGVEIVLTKLAIKEGWKKNRVKLRGVTHVMKEEKRGISQGLLDRFKMYGDVIRSIFTKI